MPEQRTPYTSSQPEWQQQPALSLPEPVDLGQHILEVLDNQTMVLVKRTQWNAMVQLDRDEAYRLMITLQSWFQDNIQRSEANPTGNKVLPCTPYFLEL